MSIKTRYAARQAGETIQETLSQSSRVGPSCKIYMPFDEGSGDPGTLAGGIVPTQAATNAWSANGDEFQASAHTGTLTSIGTNAFIIAVATNSDAIAASMNIIFGGASVGGVFDHAAIDLSSSKIRFTVGNSANVIQASGTTTYSATDLINAIMIVDKSVNGSRNYYFYTEDDGLVASGSDSTAAVQDLTLANTIEFGVNSALPNIFRQLVYYVFDDGLPSDWSDWQTEMMANLVANTKQLPARWTSI